MIRYRSKRREPSQRARAAVLFCGHGSRDVGALRECRELVAALQRQLLERSCSLGFLGFGAPDFGTALRELVAADATEVVVAPLLLAAGTHLRQDIPRLIEQARADGVLAGVTVRSAGALGIHSGMFAAARSRIKEAQSNSRGRIWLLCLGSGSPAADASTVVGTIAVRLAAELGFEGAGTAFISGVGERLPDALARVHAAGLRTVLLLPYFLFSGSLLRRGLSQARDLARGLGIDLVEAGHLGIHAGVIETVIARIAEVEMQDEVQR